MDGQLQLVEHDDPVFAPVLAALAVEYVRRYGQDHTAADTSPGDFAPPGGALLVARVDGRTVAAGGFRRVDAATCEIKRMWTAPDLRRRGHARRLLEALEELAAERGYRTVRLETGPAQPEAVALYRAAGYLPDERSARHVGALGFVKHLPSGRADG
ncbi:GNAT family N-acetyltransferase [Pseudonocardia sp. CA-107938]|uniref:GNAT family N-acetyltransferase n=1 Tax=Pseudonocardia sp. CA-107938 TaxID=3240021 RepID=UPI003D92E59E